MLGLCGVVLGFVFHTLPFWEVSAQEFIIIFVTTALIGLAGVTIERGNAERIKGLLVCELRAVIQRYGKENLIEILTEFLF